MTQGMAKREVLDRTMIGSEITMAGSQWGDRRASGRKYTIDGYYPHFVLAVDESGLSECFAYIDVWKALNREPDVGDETADEWQTEFMG